MAGSVSTRIGANAPQVCPDRAIAFIRSRHPVKTAECVSADTGVPANTVRRWIEGASSPSWSAFSRLIFAYGPSFLVAVYPNSPKCLDDAHRRERLAALEEQQARIRAEIAELV